MQRSDIGLIFFRHLFTAAVTNGEQIFILVELMADQTNRQATPRQRQKAREPAGHTLA